MRPIALSFGFGILVTISLASATTPSTPKGFGSSCSKRKDDCDTALGLRCLKGTCQCLNPDAQIYSTTHQSCLIKIGRRCGAEDDEENSTTSNINSTTVENSHCVENGECRKLKLRKWCRCKEGYMSNPEGSVCLPVARFGESCGTGDSENCEKRSGTTCVNGLCQCPFGEHQYFDQVERKCVSYANGNCSLPKISACVKNAECLNVQLRTGYTGDDGVKKIHMKSVTQCYCRKGFSEGKNGFCMASAGMECSTLQPCNAEAFLACVDGKCKCRNPLHEMLDENSGQCVSLVGSGCSPDQGGLGCVRNSECIFDDNTHKCQCKAGYTETPKKTCLLSYKQSCGSSECNSSKGLACVNSVCDCFDSHLLYDNSTQACVGVSSSFD